MADAGLFGTGRMAPKASTIHHLISYAANVSVPVADLLPTRAELTVWASEITAAAVAYAARKKAANCMDYDDLLAEWGRLLREFPAERTAQAAQFQHILIDEMQDTNTVQVSVVETVAAAGAGNLTAVGDDRPVDLPLPRREL